jgi:hypothetical protein
MGFMDKLKGMLGGSSIGSSTPISPDEYTSNGNVDLVKKINLHKQNVAVVLEKRGLAGKRVRVKFAIDQSGSMDRLYRDNTVQDTVERLYAAASKMDDDGDLELWSFNSGVSRKPSVSMANVEGYVSKNIYCMGGTNYAPAMTEIIKDCDDDNSDAPALVIFITDGDNSDHAATENVVKSASGKPIFWQFVGIGSASFSFLEKLDNMSGRVVDNANFFELNDLSKIGDEELYQRLLGEFPDWIKAATAKGILK